MRSTLILTTICLGAFLGQAGAALDGNVEVVISVAEQRMALLCDGGLVTKFPISTSRYGGGDALGSYKTPLGRLKVCDKIGGELPSGAVIKHRAATGEVLAANAPGRDPIVSRILWLEGLEEENRNARARSIYIHGTAEERAIGKPVSWGCIRMRSADVIELYDELPVGAAVTILPEKMPHYPRYVPRPPELIVSHTAPPPIAAPPPKKPANTPSTAIAASQFSSEPILVSRISGPTQPPKQSAPSKPAHVAGPVAASPGPTATLPSRALPEPIAALGVSGEVEAPRGVLSEALREPPHFATSKGNLSLKGSILMSGLDETSAPQPTAHNSPAKPEPSESPERHRSSLAVAPRTAPAGSALKPATTSE